MLSDLWLRKRRLAGAGVAVVLGVAFLFATLTTADTLRAGFDDLFAEANAGTDVVVRSGSVVGAGENSERQLLEPGVVDDVADLPGVERAVPTVDGIAQIVGTDGTPIGGDGPPTSGGAWIDDAALSPWRIAHGRSPTADHEVVIDRRSATLGDISVGDDIAVLTPTPTPVTVVGIATFGEADSLGPTTFTAFTPDRATKLLADGPGASTIRIAASPGTSAEELLMRIETALPEGVEALTGDELSAEMVADVESDFLGFVRIFLIAFAGVAVVVAAFSIQNTLSILAAQRTREAALQRAIGATRRQVFAHAVAEALVIGVVATGIGVGVGYGLGVGLNWLIDNVGVDLPDDGLTVSTTSVAVACAVGLVVTVVASLAPAVRSSRVAPIEALRDVAVDRSDRSLVRAAIGVVMLGSGVAITIVAGSRTDQPILWAGAGALLVVVGAVVLGPATVRPAVAAFGAPVRMLRGATGRLADRNARRNPGRTAASASALLVGTAVVALFATLGASITDAVESAVDESFGGDLVIEPASFAGAGLDPEMSDRVSALAEVDATAAVRITPIDVAGDPTSASAVDPTALAAVIDLDPVAGSLAGLDAGSIAIGEAYANELDVGLDDELSATLADGTDTTVRVGAIYSRTELFGELIVTLDDAPGSELRGDVAVLVDLAEDVSMADGAAAVDRVGAEFAAPGVQTRDEYVDGIAAEIDQLLALIYGLLALAVLIALMGIANTLSLAVHERTRELGLLRAVGQTRSQLRSTVRWESALTAVFGTAGGVGLGVFLGWGLMRAIEAEEGIGGFAIPVGPLAIVVAVAAASGTVAAISPARRAARLDVIDALSTQ
ncbi:FtsX-like permease family protein [Ilumatobacter sp.]|uniref:FtsX-like permease family protein n=1 Tax=Ilumatobacter sp. TaxID=1967498 RepID=UPI003B521556